MDDLTRAAGPARKLASKIEKIAKARPIQTGVQIPVIEGSPDPDVTNLWLNNAGNLFAYRADGVMMSYQVRTGYTANGVAPADEPDYQTYRVTANAADIDGNYPGIGQVYEIQTLCPTHGVEPGAFYGYTPGHGNRRITFTVFFGSSMNPAESGSSGNQGPTAVSVVRAYTIKLRNAATYSGGPVQLHFGFTGSDAARTPTYRDVFVDTWPAQGYGGDLDGEHALPVEMIISDISTGYFAPNNRIQFMILQPDNDVASSGELDPTTIEIALTFTDQVYS